MPKPTPLDALIDSLGTVQRPLLDQLNKAQRAEFDHLVERHTTGKLNVSWDKLAEAMRKRWGLDTLSRNTLKTAIEKAKNNG